MKTSLLIHQRLINQKLAASEYTRPEQIVSWMGAVQAQEYGMAKWAVGLRVNGIRDADVDAALNDGRILRTHVLRPTWHFVVPEDIRWMLEISKTQVHKLNAYYYKQRELDAKTLNRCADIVAKGLEGGKQLTRSELTAVLGRKKIVAEGERLGSILMYAELEGIICSGARKGKQFAYALLDERVQQVRPIDKEEAAGMLAERYFTSRGPATVADFAWWSGLSIRDARAGMEMLGKEFETEVLDGQEYVFLPTQSEKVGAGKAATFLMPDYDEYGIAYKDRSAMMSDKAIDGFSRGNPVFNRIVIIDGVAGGTWNVKLGKAGPDIALNLYKPLSKRAEQAVKKAIDRYNAFIVSK